MGIIKNNKEEYIKKLRELIDQYEKESYAMPLTSIASIQYHLEVDLKFLLAFFSLTEKYTSLKSKNVFGD